MVGRHQRLRRLRKRWGAHRALRRPRRRVLLLRALHHDSRGELLVVDSALPQRQQLESRRVQRLQRPHGRQHDRHQSGLRGQSVREAQTVMVFAQPSPSSAAPTSPRASGALVVLFAVLVVESSFELCITIRAASCFARLSSIRRCLSRRFGAASAAATGAAGVQARPASSSSSWSAA